MMNEPQYARSPYHHQHRYGSLALVVVSAVHVAYGYGPGVAIRLHATIVLPLPLIWFADDLAITAMRRSGGWLSARRADGMVRLCGWAGLLLMLGYWAFRTR
jgi:hypothetical protein